MVRPFLILLMFFLSLPALAQDYSTPEATFKTYMEAMKAADFAATDTCYTASSREMLAKNPAFSQNRPAEMLTQTHDRFSQLTWTTEQVNSKRAILTSNDSKVPPIFMRQQTPGEGWRIDFHFMASYIRADQNGWSWVNPKAEAIWKSRE